MTIILALTLVTPVTGITSDEPKLPFVIICKPAGKIMYENRCLNANVFFQVLELGRGAHQNENQQTQFERPVIHLESRQQQNDRHQIKLQEWGPVNPRFRLRFPHFQQIGHRGRSVQTLGK